MGVKKVLLAQPRGFCAGVEMAVEVVERALQKHGPPIYVFHEIVHNRHVVQEFVKRGVRFVQSVGEVPQGAKLIFSAHGISPAVWEEARQRNLQVVIDATCPLVEKVHREVRKYASQGYWIILVGHEYHDEIVGTSGEAPERIKIVGNVEEAQAVAIPDPEKLAVLTQTTLSVDDTREIIATLRQRFPRMVTPAKEDICYATQNRQDAVKALAPQCDVVIVVGSPTSSNSNRLREVAENLGVPAYMVDNASEIDPRWVSGKKQVGVTAGASAPEILVRAVIERLSQLGIGSVADLDGVQEKVGFPLPKGLG